MAIIYKQIARYMKKSLSYSSLIRLYRLQQFETAVQRKYQKEMTVREEFYIRERIYMSIKTGSHLNKKENNNFHCKFKEMYLVF